MNSIKPPKRREIYAGKEVLDTVKGCCFVRFIWTIREKLQTQLKYWDTLYDINSRVHFRVKRELGHRKLHVNNTARYVRTRE
jgi:hypothetical protein